MLSEGKSIWAQTVERFILDICPSRWADEEKLVQFIKLYVSQKNEVWAKWNLLEDDAGNIAIHIPAKQQRFSQLPPVLLQAHLDMVQSSSQIQDGEDMYDYSKWIFPEETPDGEWIQSVWKTTTLWADCGIGIAGALQLAEVENRPPLVIILTRDEEGDMTWAFHINPEKLGIWSDDIQYLVNLDNNYEDQILIGSWGGLSMKMDGHYEVESPTFPQYKIRFSDLQWGHSGEDIDKGRMNIICEMCNFLKRLDKHSVPFELWAIQSGKQENAIPSYWDLILWIPDDQIDAFEDLLRQFYKDLKIRYPEEREFSYALQPIEKKSSLYVMDHEQTMSIVKAFWNQLLWEIVRDEEFAIPKTSNNVWVCEIKNGIMKVQFYGRSDNPESMYKLWAYLWNDFFDAGLELRKTQPISPWSPEFTSGFLEIAKTAYKQVHNILPKVVKTHSSLECGILKKNIEKVSGRVLQVISCWPRILDEHSNTERLHKKSVDVWMEFLQRLMWILAEKDAKALK